MTQESDLRDIGATVLTSTKGSAYVNRVANQADATAIFTQAGRDYVALRQSGGSNPSVFENQYLQALLARQGVRYGLSVAAVSAGEAGYVGISPQHPAFAGIQDQVSSFYGAFAPLPHPDAANQELGPNVGGSDGVFLPGDSAGVPGSGGSVSQGVGGLLLAGGVVLLVLLAFRRK